jgi:hypothetical protein
MAVTGVLAGDALAALAAAIDASPAATSSLKRVLGVLRARVATNGGTADATFVAETAASLVPVAAALVAAAKTDETTEKKTEKTIDAVPTVKTERVPSSPGPPPPPSIADADVTLSTSAPVSFGTPRGRFDVKISDDAFALASTTPKGTTTHLVLKAHVRKLMELKMGDSNETTCVMVAIDPAHAPVHGKQKLTTLLLQVRPNDKPVGVIHRGGAISMAEGVDDVLRGSEGPVRACVALMERACGRRAFAPGAPGTKARSSIITPVPVRPRRRGARRSLRTLFPARASLRQAGPTVSIPTHAPRRLTTPPLTPFNATPISSLAWTTTVSASSPASAAAAASRRR